MLSQAQKNIKSTPQDEGHCPSPYKPQDLQTMSPEVLVAIEDHDVSPVTTIPSMSSSAPGKSRKQSSLADMVKNIGNLTNIFHRKDSAQDLPSEVGSHRAPSPGILDNLRDSQQGSSASAKNGERAHDGMARFSNVSQFFNKREIAGESSHWYATDEYLSWQNSSVVALTPTPATNREAGAGETRWKNLREYSPKPNRRLEQSLPKPSLKDVLDAVLSWLSKRPSAKGRGKRPERRDNLSTPPLPSSAPQKAPVFQPSVCPTVPKVLQA